MDARNYLLRKTPYDVRLMGSLAKRGVSGRGGRLKRVPREQFPPRAWHQVVWPLNHAPKSDIAALRLVAEDVNGLVLPPGATFAYWKTVRRLPGVERFRSNVTLRSRQQQIERVDAHSLVASALYQLALYGGLQILERHPHAHLAPGPLGTFKPGRDAGVEYGFRDLRFRNPHAEPVVISIEVDDWEVRASLLATSPVSFDVMFDEVVQPISPGTMVLSDPGQRPGMDRVIENGAPGYHVETTRIVIFGNGERRIDDLPDSDYEPVATVLGRGPAVRERSRESTT